MARKFSVLREECIRLRVEQRMSYDEISTSTEASKGNLHYWLKENPLTEQELKARRGAAGTKSRIQVGEARRYKPGIPSKFKSMVIDETISSNRMGKISEAAVLFRLVLVGLNAFTSPFDGERTDIIAENLRTSKIMKLQVKTVRRPSHGAPYIPLLCKRGSGTERYGEGDFDFIVGYDLHRDTAYVASWLECNSVSTTLSIRPDLAERWDKLA